MQLINNINIPTSFKLRVIENFDIINDKSLSLIDKTDRLLVPVVQDHVARLAMLDQNNITDVETSDIDPSDVIQLAAVNINLLLILWQLCLLLLSLTHNPQEAEYQKLIGKMLSGLLEQLVLEMSILSEVAISQKRLAESKAAILQSSYKLQLISTIVMGSVGMIFEVKSLCGSMSSFNTQQEEQKLSASKETALEMLDNKNFQDFSNNIKTNLKELELLSKDAPAAKEVFISLKSFNKETREIEENYDKFLKNTNEHIETEINDFNNKQLNDSNKVSALKNLDDNTELDKLCINISNKRDKSINDLNNELQNEGIHQLDIQSIDRNKINKVREDINNSQIQSMDKQKLLKTIDDIENINSLQQKLQKRSSAFALTKQRYTTQIDTVYDKYWGTVMQNSPKQVVSSIFAEKIVDFGQPNYKMTLENMREFNGMCVKDLQSLNVGQTIPANLKIQLLESVFTSEVKGLYTLNNLSDLKKYFGVSTPDFNLSDKQYALALKLTSSEKSPDGKSVVGLCKSDFNTMQDNLNQRKTAFRNYLETLPRINFGGMFFNIMGGVNGIGDKYSQVGVASSDGQHTWQENTANQASKSTQSFTKTTDQIMESIRNILKKIDEIYTANKDAVMSLLREVMTKAGTGR